MGPPYGDVLMGPHRSWLLGPAIDGQGQKRHFFATLPTFARSRLNHVRWTFTEKDSSLWASALPALRIADSIRRVNPLNLIETEPGAYSITMHTGDLPVDPVVEDLGHVPNGVFWDGVAE